MGQVWGQGRKLCIIVPVSLPAGHSASEVMVQLLSKSLSC